MKRIRSTGAGTKKNKAELITPEEEESLWSSKTLGDHSPISLLNTILCTSKRTKASAITLQALSNTDSGKYWRATIFTLQ